MALPYEASRAHSLGAILLQSLIACPRIAIGRQQVNGATILICTWPLRRQLWFYYFRSKLVPRSLQVRGPLAAVVRLGASLEVPQDVFSPKRLGCPSPLWNSWFGSYKRVNVVRDIQFNGTPPRCDLYEDRNDSHDRNASIARL